jgi:T5SS/PEP-CTERM-associated repeat protein
MVARTFSLSIALVTLLLAGRAQAVVKTWAGSDGGSYSAPGNWDPGGTPGTADSLLFANGAVGSTYDIDFDVDSTVTQLTVATNPLAFAGASHTLSLTSTLIIGRTGSGTGNALLSTSLAQLNTTYAGLGGDSGTSGTLNVTAGTFNVSGTAASDDVVIGYWGTGAINVTNGADVTVAGDTNLAYFGGAVGNISVMGSGSTWTSTGAVRFSKGTGTITVAGGGALSASALSLGFSGCTLAGNGTVTAPVVNANGTVSPSGLSSSFGTLQITGAYTQGANGKLRIEINDTTAGTFDRLGVSGGVNLAGTLQVTLSSFTPAQNDVFDILDFTSRLGTFATLTLPPLSGALEWDTTKLYVDGSIRVVLPGDFNENGVVDGADYVVWRKGLGTTYVASDYNVWRTHLGGTASGGAAAAASALPEPATALLVCMAGLVVTCNVRCAKNRSHHGSMRSS